METKQEGLSRAGFAEALARQGLAVPAERFETAYAAACALEQAVAPLRGRSRALPAAPAALPRLEEPA